LNASFSEVKYAKHELKYVLPSTAVACYTCGIIPSTALLSAVLCRDCLIRQHLESGYKEFSIGRVFAPKPTTGSSIERFSASSLIVLMLSILSLTKKIMPSY